MVFYGDKAADNADDQGAVVHSKHLPQLSFELPGQKKWFQVKPKMYGPDSMSCCDFEFFGQVFFLGITDSHDHVGTLCQQPFDPHESRRFYSAEISFKNMAVERMYRSNFFPMK